MKKHAILIIAIFPLQPIIPIVPVILVMLLMLLTACNPTPATLPTLAILPTTAPSLTFTPSHTPTVTATPSPTTMPSVTPLLAGEAPRWTQAPTPTVTNTLPPNTPSPTSPATATLLPPVFTFGTSVEGRPLEGFRYGTGPQILMLIGGIHAGFEANTVDLVRELNAHFARTPGDILPGMTLVLVPALNPDGLARGRRLEGRFNSNMVDLNRNWGCGWSPEAEFGLGPVDPGNEPFSEPESTALGSLIQQTRPAAVVFYHAAANGVFGGDCGGISSDALAQVYGDASGYPYGRAFSSYNVTGSAPAWVASEGIPALDVELASAQLTEFRRNLNAILAVQRWLTTGQP